MSDTCPRGGSSPPKTKAIVDSDGSKEKDDEVQRALAASSECMKESSAIAGGDNNKHVNLQETAFPKRPTYPTLPEEPKAEKNLLSRVSVRLPDGPRVQHNFLCSDSIQRWWLELELELEKRFVRHRVKNSRDYAWRTRTVLLCVKLNPISLVENVLASVANASALSLASKMMDSSPIPSIHYFGCVFFLLYLRIILSPISS